MIRLSAPYVETFCLYARRMESVASRQGCGRVIKSGLMEGLARCLVYEYAGVVQDGLLPSPSAAGRQAGSRQRRADMIMRDFLYLVAERRGRLRSVKEAAKVMNMSVKHLSKVIMDTCGERAINIINNSTMRNAMRLSERHRNVCKRGGNGNGF